MFIHFINAGPKTARETKCTSYSGSSRTKEVGITCNLLQPCIAIHVTSYCVQHLQEKTGTF